MAWDIQSFDDGWMIFDRNYKLDSQGRILDYDLRRVLRGPPERMRYVIDEDTGEFGGQWWVCPKCRGSYNDYMPETEPQPCGDCGCKTYEVFAYATKEWRSEEPIQFYIRGEFVHASEYEPSKYYGYSPIVTLYDEARAVEKMDEWYREAYEQRRAPRGAITIRSSNADATRKWNRGQLEKLNSDPNHIPTLMDDSEGGGGADPIKFVQLLDSPADMQHMEMREWIKDRISAKYGVTEIMMSGSPANSGLSQSMEVQVSNRAADRLRKIFNNIFVPAFLGQIGTEGWTRCVADVEEEDEMAAAEKQQRQLQIAQQAAQLGLSVEWTKDMEAHVKPGEVEMDDEGGLAGMMGGMGDDMGGFGDEGGDAFGDAEGQNQLDGVNQAGGGPREDSKPNEDAAAFGRMAKDIRDHGEIEVFNADSGAWEKAEMVHDLGDKVHCKTETGVDFYVTDTGEVISA